MLLFSSGQMHLHESINYAYKTGSSGKQANVGCGQQFPFAVPVQPVTSKLDTFFCTLLLDTLLTALPLSKLTHRYGQGQIPMGCESGQSQRTMHINHNFSTVRNDMAWLCAAHTSISYMGPNWLNKLVLEISPMKLVILFCFVLVFTKPAFDH